MKDFVAIGDIIKPLIINLGKISGNNISEALSFDLEVLSERIEKIKEKKGVVNED